MNSNRKKIIKFILASVLIIIITGGFVGYKMWTKPHRNVSAAKGITVTAAQVASAYESNEPAANSKYLDKVLEVTGTVHDISKNQKGETVLTLNGSDMSGVICTLENASPVNVKPGAAITIKGICTGFLTDVVLVRCIVQ